MTFRAPAAAVVLLLAAVTGCSSSGRPPAATPSATGSPTGSPTPAASVTALVTSSPSAAAVKPVLVLQPDGLGVLVKESSIRQLPFSGTSASQITTVVTNVLGTGKRSALPDCGQGARSSYQVKGFSLLFDGTKWVGWHDQGAPGRTLTSANGVGIGITLAKLRTLEPGVKVTKGTLGAEFTTGDAGFGGFLTGTTSSSKVTSVYAGETCFFR